MPYHYLKTIDEIPRDCRVWIYGSGTAGRSLLILLKKLRRDITINGFLDSFKNGSCGGKRMLKFDDFLAQKRKLHFDSILIASAYCEQIAQGLEKAGLHNFFIIKIIAPVLANIASTTLLKRLVYALKKALLKLITVCGRRHAHDYIFISGYGGLFVGNCKYFCLYLQENKDARITWCTLSHERFNDMRHELAGLHIDLIRFPTLRAIWRMAHAAYFVFDNSDWHPSFPLIQEFAAKKIQLWHGVGFKIIERIWSSEILKGTLLPREQKLLNRMYPKYDLLVTTSPFYATHVFAPAFGIAPEHIAISGYPRNDIFYHPVAGSELFSDSGILAEARTLRLNGTRIITYTPTFRDLKQTVDFDQILRMDELNAFLKQNNLLLVIKGHSHPIFNIVIQAIERFSQLRLFKSQKDIYPLLALTDLLITDYSSIYTDFLHTQRPVLFFPYDYTEYIELYRDIQFDYNAMTPGPKAANYHELIHWISHFLVAGQDGFATERRRILDLTFAHQDGLAAQRIVQEIAQRFC